MQSTYKQNKENPESVCAQRFAHWSEMTSWNVQTQKQVLLSCQVDVHVTLH